VRRASVKVPQRHSTQAASYFGGFVTGFDRRYRLPSTLWRARFLEQWKGHSVRVTIFVAQQAGVRPKAGYSNQRGRQSSDPIRLPKAILWQTPPRELRFAKASCDA